MTLPTIDEITRIGTAIGIIVVLIMRKVDAYRTEKQRERVNATSAVAAIKQAETHEEIKEVKAQSEAIHGLVNGGMRLQMEVAAKALRRVADLTNNHEDHEVAVLAETKLAEHVAKQPNADTLKTI